MLAQADVQQGENTDWQISDYTKTLLRLLEKTEEQAEYERYQIYPGGESAAKEPAWTKL